MQTPLSAKGTAEAAPLTTAPGVFDDGALGQYLGGIEPRTLRLWRRKRGLPFLKLTKKVIRYRQSDIDRWLDQHRVAISGGFH